MREERHEHVTTQLSDQITAVRFLCPPVGGGTSLHLNMVEHRGRFWIDCLSCCDAGRVAGAIQAAFEGRGLTVERAADRSFTLPTCPWREGMEPGA